MYWHKQQPDKPLFPDLVWSKPENRLQAGKLLIIGGNAAGFAVAGQAFQTAQRAGAGSVRVVLPDILRSSVPKEIHFEVEFAPSVAHGSFSKNSLTELLASSAWADAVFLPGGIGRNSETSVLLELFVGKYKGLLIVAEDAVEVFIDSPEQLLARPDTVVIADFSQLQKMWNKMFAHLGPLTYSMPLQAHVRQLHTATLSIASAVISRLQSTLQVAYQGEVSTTTDDRDIWRVETATKAAVWAMQHPGKLFEALSTSLVRPEE